MIRAVNAPVDLSGHSCELTASQDAVDRSLPSTRVRRGNSSNEWIREAREPKQQLLRGLAHIEIEVASDNEWKPLIVTEGIVE